MNYKEIAKINVNEHIEKKNNLSYLSWAWAVDQLLRLDETANWEYREPVRFGDTVMVFCTVTAFGRSRTAQLPVMDHRNKAIINPDAFQVNTAMQRCLAKAIALHGLGLYIYAGEDLPEAEKEPELKMPPLKSKDWELTEERAFQLYQSAKRATELHAQDKPECYDELSGITDNEEKLYLWAVIKEFSSLRSYLKRRKEEESKDPQAAAKVPA